MPVISLGRQPFAAELAATMHTDLDRAAPRQDTDLPSSAGGADRSLRPDEQQRIEECVAAVEGRSVRIDVLARFGSGPDRLDGVVVRACGGNRYLLARDGGSWRLAEPETIEAEIRAVEQTVYSKRAALSVLGHQWSGE